MTNATNIKSAKADFWQNANGTFSHRLNRTCEWGDEAACRADFKFHQEWERG